MVHCHTSGCDVCDEAWYDPKSGTWICPYAVSSLSVLETGSVSFEDEDT